MKAQKIILDVIDAIKEPNECMAKMSLNNVHMEGLFSLVVVGDEPGRLTRVFIADKKIKPFDVQLHSHRYPIRLTTIKGKIRHHVAEEKGLINLDGDVVLSKFMYRSFLNGGGGMNYVDEVSMSVKDYLLPIGSTTTMSHDEVHTVSCSKGSIWIVEELGFATETSLVYGVPFVLDGLYNEPGMFQINDKAQLVLRELKKIHQSYQLA